MQVKHPLIHQRDTVSEKPLELKQGEVYRASVKENVADNEAVILIRGKEVRAKFAEGAPAAGSRVTIQVNGASEQSVHVQTIANENTKSVDKEEKIFQRLGVGKEQANIKQAVRILLDKELPVSKEIVKDIKQFIDKIEGSLETKLETVRALANKKLEATFPQLRAVHEALHGEPLNKVLSKIAKEIDPNFVLEKKESAKVQQNPTKVNQEPVRKSVSSETIKTEIKSVPNKQSAQQTELVNLLKKGQELIAKEPNLAKAVDQIKEEIVKNPKLDRELAQKIEKAAQEAQKLNMIGKERLDQALKSAEEQLIQKESRTVQSSETPKVVSVKNSNEMDLSTIVKNISKEVSKIPSLNHSIALVKDQLVSDMRFSQEVRDKVSQALKEATSLGNFGRVTTGKEVVNRVLADAQQMIDKVDGRASQPTEQIKEKAASETVKEVKVEVQKEPIFQRVVEKVRDQVVNNPKVDREVAQRVEQAVKEATQLKQGGQETAGRDRLQQALAKAEVELEQIEPRQQQKPSETVKEVKAEVRKEPNFQRAVEKVREQVVNNPKVDREVAQRVEQSIKEATQLKQGGQETAGRDRLQQALAKAEIELHQKETNQIQTNRSEQPGKTVKVETILQRKTEISQPVVTKIEAEPKSSPVRLPEQPEHQDTQSKKNVQQPTETVKQTRESIQQESDIHKVQQKVQDLLANHKNLDQETVRNIQRLANQAQQLDQSGRDRLMKVIQQVENILKDSNTQMPTNVTQKELPSNQPDLTKGTQDADLPAQSMANDKKPSESLKEALTKLQKEPQLEQALNQMRKEVASNPNIDLETAEKIDKVLDKGQQLMDKGREIAARQHLSKELTHIQQELIETEPNIQPDRKASPDTLNYELNEQLQSLNLQSKDILVTKVTEKLAQVTNDFRELKREITRNLDNVERLIQTHKNQANPQAKQMLENTIHKLDNAILKSEMMLFTDMKTEKQLLQASSQLAEAKKLLSKGQHAEAGKIVHDVKNLIDKVIYKPTDQKIMHYVNQESVPMEEPTQSRQMLSKLQDATYGTSSHQEASARQIFELVRSLGLNNESDVANSLVFQKNDAGKQEQHENLKSLLMKLSQGEGQEVNGKVAQQAEQALTNITGQQLLSKSDTAGTLQSMFFQLPLLLGGKPENLQVFINSKSEGQQVEWENCNLYFLLETKKLGDVGILLNSTDRNLSITIKNDLPGFKERMEPLAIFTKEKLQEVGYSVSSINFTKMNPVVSQEKKDSEGKQATKMVFTEKGMDFTI